MFCPNCGAEVKEGQQFCGTCGTKIAQAAASSPEVGAAPAQPQPSVPGPQQPQAPQASSALQDASRPQQVQESSWNEVSTQAKASWSTPYAIVSLVGKVIVLIALFMPCVASPLLKVGMAYLSSMGSDLGDLLGSSAPGVSSVLSTSIIGRGEWNMIDFHTLMDQLGRVMNLAVGNSTDFAAMNAASQVNAIVTFATVAFVIWILMIVALLFCIIRPFLKSGRLAAAEGKVNIDMIIMLVIALLSLVWCVIVIYANGALESAATIAGSSDVTTALALGKILDVPVGPWVAVVLSVLVAFWPHLSKYVGLSK